MGRVAAPAAPGAISAVLHSRCGAGAPPAHRGEAGTLTRAHHLAYYATLGLLPYWWHATLFSASTPGVYYTYDSLLVFAADVPLVVTIALWAVTPRASPRPAAPWWTWAPLALLTLVSLAGAATSPVPVVSLGIAVHLLLLCLLVLYTVREQPNPAIVATVFCGNLIAQAALAGIQLATQSTLPLGTWFLGWPQELPAVQPGAAVVQTLEGARWLRAYGSFPHPNVLGGYAVAGLLVAAGWFVGRGSRPAFATVLAGGAVLLLTFSRGAWVGLAAGVAAALIVLGSVHLRRLIVVSLALVLVWAALAAALGSFFLTRLAGQDAPLEGRSTAERGILQDRALTLWARLPLTGVGAGASVVTQHQMGLGEPVEPVHSVPLLLLAETGPAGAAAWLLQAALFTAVAFRMRRSSGPWAASLTGAVAALLVAGLFDHYLWSMGPGRTLWWAVWSLWAAEAFRTLQGAGNPRAWPCLLAPQPPPSGLVVVSLKSAANVILWETRDPELGEKPLRMERLAAPHLTRPPVQLTRR